MNFRRLTLTLIFCASTQVHQSQATEPFALCESQPTINCVVDGDTLHWQGEKLRLIDIDAPEIFSPKCAAEYNLGLKARDRLLELLNASAIDVKPQGHRDRDVYGRLLRLVTIDGTSVGSLLISEGLAASWQGHHHVWCE